MKISAELMVQAKIVPRLKLYIKSTKKSTGTHKVKLISDRIVKDTEFGTGKEIEYVEYTLEENGEKKVYKTKLKNKDSELSYLVQNLAEFKEGEEVFMEMKKMGIKNYVEVSPVNAKSAEIEEDEQEVGEDVAY